MAKEDEELEDFDYEETPETVDGVPLEDFDYEEGENRWLETAANSFLFGAYPRVKAAYDTGTFGFESLGASPEQVRDYTAAKRYEEKENAAYRQRNPWSATGADIVGAAVNPANYWGPLGGLRVAQAARAGHVIDKGLPVGQRIARGAGFGKVGGVGSESAALAAKQGALYGGLSSPEESLVGRASDAVTSGIVSAPLGYGVGKFTQALQAPVRGAYNAGKEIAEGLATSQPHRGGKTSAQITMNRELARAGTSAREIADTIVPETIFGDRPAMIAQGRALREALKSSAGDPVNEYVRLMREAAARGEVKDFHESTLRRQYERGTGRALGAEGEGTVPLTLDEVASSRHMLDPEGDRSYRKGLVDTRRAIAMTPGEHQEKLQNHVLNRQRNVLDHTRQKMDDLVGTEATYRELADQNRQLKDELFEYALENEQPFDVRDVLEEFWQKEVWRGGKVEDAVKDILRTFGVDPSSGIAERTTLQKMIDQRTALNQAIQDSMETGGRRTAVTRELQDLKNKIDERLIETNPAWKEANDVASNGHRIREAYEEGQRISVSGTGRQSREILDKVNNLNQRISTTASQRRKLITKRNKGGLTESEEGQLDYLEKALKFMQNERAAYRQGWIEVLQDQIGKAGDMHDPGKYFAKGGFKDARTGPKKAVEIMFGKDNAKKFLDRMDDVARVGQTTRQYGGSQTAEMQEKMASLRMDDFVNAAADMATLNPGGIFRPLARKAAMGYGERRNRHLGEMFTADTSDLPAMMKMLNELDEFSKSSTMNRDPHKTALEYLPESLWFGAPGAAASGTSRRLIDELNAPEFMYKEYLNPKDEEEY